jgi:hypothetical protein
MYESSTQPISKNTPSKLSMSFKDYSASLDLKDDHLENGWGWFVDIDTENEKISSEHRFDKKNNYGKNKEIRSIPPISEASNINVMKLYNELYMYSYYENNPEKMNPSKSNAGWIIHATCLLSVVTCLFIVL